MPWDAQKQNFKNAKVDHWNFDFPQPQRFQVLHTAIVCVSESNRQFGL